MNYDDDEEMGGLNCHVSTKEEGTTVSATADITHVREHVIDQAIRRAVKAEIEKRVASHVDEIAKEEIRARLAPRIEKILDDGWPMFSNYGQPCGTKRLPEMIADWIKGSDGYQRTNMQGLIAEAIRKQLEKPFADEIEAAKKRFRQQCDELLGGQIAQGLRSAFGLR